MSHLITLLVRCYSITGTQFHFYYSPLIYTLHSFIPFIRTSSLQTQHAHIQIDRQFNIAKMVTMKSRCQMLRLVCVCMSGQCNEWFKPLFTKCEHTARIVVGILSSCCSVLYRHLKRSHCYLHNFLSLVLVRDEFQSA